MAERFDKIIVGAGLYGLYAALVCVKRGERVVVLEKDRGIFRRATYINQARVHMGYHYPRSYSTATRSAGYFERFVRDYGFCVVDDFEQVYATSAAYSWSDRRQFIGFCANAGIPCREIMPSRYFKRGMCDGAFVTREYAYDAALLRGYFEDCLGSADGAELRFGQRITAIENDGVHYIVSLKGGAPVAAPYLLNAAYAGANELLAMAGLEPFKIKYELCEIILVDVGKGLKETGVTVMDGPFFSIMPFGRTPRHSLTSVTFTPHATSGAALPAFECQARSGGLCRPGDLYNCDDCPARPETAYPYMSRLARKYLLDSLDFEYAGSLFSMKPILKASEIDDSRPTVVRVFGDSPRFVSVLSGKINTVYDLDEVL
jgi:hypothetical protein